MKRRNILLIFLVIVVIAAGIAVLREWHWFPFSAETRDTVFLGCTFGMSPQEVKSILRKQHAELMDYPAFTQAEPRILGPIPLSEDPDASPLYAEDRKRPGTFSLYMPSMNMFEAACQAQFQFRDNRLTYIVAYFRRHLASRSESQELVDILNRRLKSKYKFVAREEDKREQFLGVYTLVFSNPGVKATLLVDLRDEMDPQISLHFVDTVKQEERTERIRKREEEGL